MSLPRLVAQVAVIGVQILGKAFLQAGRQALKNAQAAEAGGASASVRASSNPLTQRHKMAIDEAYNILNVRATEKGLEESALREMLKNYEHLFKVNENTSHYLQSKVVRAKARIEAEVQAQQKPAPAAGSSASSNQPQQPPSK